MPHLICYDISGNSLRARMGKKIIGFGLDRINKSVYLGTIQKRPYVCKQKFQVKEKS